MNVQLYIQIWQFGVPGNLRQGVSLHSATTSKASANDTTHYQETPWYFVNDDHPSTHLCLASLCYHLCYHQCNFGCWAHSERDCVRQSTQTPSNIAWKRSQIRSLCPGSDKLALLIIYCIVLYWVWHQVSCASSTALHSLPQWLCRHFCW